MARKSPDSRMKHLVAIAASLVLAGGGIAAPGIAVASTVTAHSAKVTHHKKAHAKATHKPAAHKTKHSSKTAREATQAKKQATQPKNPAPTTPPNAGPTTVASSAAACANGNVIPTSANLDLVRAATLCLINQQRVIAGVAPLSENATLDAAALAHSNDMVAGNYFDHVAPTGADPLSRVVTAGFATVAKILDFGENIAAAGGSLASPAATVADWMSSAPHRANILDPTFKQTGLGVAAAVPGLLGLGGSGATYTQDFATTA
jgi:uncharacterized protein YkwD